MPFQNSKSRKINRLANITLLTAGEDRFEICPPAGIVNLTAIIAGSPAGNSFEWEQISGSPVTIDDPTALSTFYTASGTDDKTFRFYVDRNTTSEQFDDVTIFGTPTSFLRGALPSVDSSFAEGFELDPVECSSIVGDVVFTAAPPAGNIGQGTATFIFELTWNHPGSSKDTYIIQYQIIENGIPVSSVPSTPLAPVSSGQTPLGPPSDPLFYSTTAPPPPNHQILTIYNINGVEYVEPSCIQDFSGIDIPNAEVMDDAARAFLVSADSGFTRVSYENISQDAEAAAEPFLSSVDANASIVRYATFSQGPEITDSGPYFLSQDQTFTVLRTDPSGIGGS